MATVHPAIPVCHLPTVLQAYARLWEDLSPGTSAELLVLILAVVCTGAATLGIGQSSVLYEMYSELAHEIDISSYYATPSPSSIMLLQGVVIMNTFRASYLPPFTAYGFLPLAIRFAQSLRLHIDQNAENDIDREVQRRLWWYLVYLDKESTIASGLPAIIWSGSHTTRRPSILWSDATQEYETNTPSPMMIAMHGHWEWAYCMQIWFERKPEQHEIVHFNQIIENLLRMIGDSRESEWTHIYLQMLIDRAYCMLGLRFWKLDLFKGIDCHSEIVRYAYSYRHTVNFS